MKRTLLLILWFCTSPALVKAQVGIYQHGTVVRMHMGDCILAHHGFMASFGGPSAPMMEEPCPEYTLVSDKVVFVIVAKSSNQLIPLAEVIDFRFQHNELAVRVDDAKREVKFTIKEMTLRGEWERLQRHIEEEINTPRPLDGALALRNRE